jgi:hypothetical protein
VWLLFGACSWIDPPVVEAVVGHDPGAERHVWLFREQADGTFQRDPAPFAHSLTSLGLAVVDDTLVLTALGVWMGSISEWRRNWLGAPIHGLSTTDLETWKPIIWRLHRDPADRAPIDPQLHVTPDGLSLFYLAVPPMERGDPALAPTDRTISRAKVDGGATWDADVLTAPTLADPSPVSFLGQDWLFATTRPGNEITLFAGEPLARVRTWSGVSVPHAFVHDGKLELWANRWLGGQQVAVRTLSADGRNFTAWQQPLPIEGLRHCASPVGASWQGKIIVVCVDELPVVPHQGPPPKGPPVR